MPDVQRIEILDGGLSFTVKRLDADGYYAYSEIAGVRKYITCPANGGRDNVNL